MGIFIRTLIVTLIFCLGYFGWVYFSKEGYSPDLHITGEAKNTLVQDDKPAQEPQNPSESENPAQNQNPALQSISIALLDDEDTIKYVTRQARHKTLYTALGLLMKGPSDEEKEMGIFTEIPSNARLISVKKNEADGSIIINLTKEFGEGGGTQSVQARLKQIVKTVNMYAGKAPVYLYLDGKKAQYLGGEGIYIEQPINK